MCSFDAPIFRDHQVDAVVSGNFCPIGCCRRHLALFLFPGNAWRFCIPQSDETSGESATTANSGQLTLPFVAEFKRWQSMNREYSLHPVQAIAAALGGRIISAWAWMLWMCVCFAGAILQHFSTQEVIRQKSKAALAMSVVGVVMFSVFLIRCSLSAELRAERVELRVGRVFTLGVWIVPFFGLGALLAPLILR